MALRRDGMSVLIELAVSTCVVSTALIWCPVSARSAASTRFMSAGADLPKSSTSTSIPIARAELAQERPNCPTASTSAFSPLEKRLALAASHPAWPLPM
jgi:hypothetical protein